MDAAQCRMARAGLGIAGREFAKSAGIGYATLARFETGQAIADDSRAKIEKALADAGASFVDRGGRIGVTIPRRENIASRANDKP